MITKTELELLYPLSEFYEEAGLPLPSVGLIEGQKMPQPYRELLVHEDDMTPTLEAAHGRSIVLRVLKHSLRDNVFSRQVLLVLEDSGTPVEFGAIQIYLDHLPEEARRLVLEKRQPLGTILHTQQIAHESSPSAYLRIAADELMKQSFGLVGPAILYGRCNVLTDTAGRELARVVEILPPADVS